MKDEKINTPLGYIYPIEGSATSSCDRYVYVHLQLRCPWVSLWIKKLTGKCFVVCRISTREGHLAGDMLIRVVYETDKVR